MILSTANESSRFLVLFTFQRHHCSRFCIDVAADHLLYAGVENLLWRQSEIPGKAAGRKYKIALGVRRKNGQVVKDVFDDLL